MQREISIIIVYNSLEKFNKAVEKCSNLLWEIRPQLWELQV